jgi:membrane protein YqaA with SNARE-associated domain
MTAWGGQTAGALRTGFNRGIAESNGESAAKRSQLYEASANQGGRGPWNRSARLYRLHELLSSLFSLVSRFGGVGLFALTLLDASFLFIPFGPDLLLVVMAARSHEMAPFYALLAAAGSVAGCAIIDPLSRKEGEKGLERLLSRRRLQSVTKRVRKSAPWALSIASLMPPPFPFTPIIIAASALQYPRKKLLTVVGVSRLVRYMTEALLALYFGHQLVEISKSKGLELAVIVLIVISLVGSAITAYKWVQKRKKQEQPA